jgi:hypothetical protein
VLIKRDSVLKRDSALKRNTLKKGTIPSLKLMYTEKINLEIIIGLNVLNLENKIKNFAN